MALQESYAELVERSRMLEKAGMHTASYDILRRVSLRLSRLSPETLKKREDLHSLFLSALMDADQMGRRLGRTEEVVELGDALSRVMPDLAAMGELIKAQALNDAGRIDEGMTLMLAASQPPSDMIGPYKAMASEALWFKRPADALSILAHVPDKELPEADKDGRREQAEVNYLRFRALAAQGEMEQAAETWLKAYHQSRQDPPPAREIVSAFIERGELDKALDFADREGQPATRGLLRGLVAWLKGKREWALDEWSRVAREPFNVESGDFTDWVECALRVAELEKVDKALEAGFQKFGFISRMFLLEGVMEALQGNLDTARRFFRAIVMANVGAKWQRQEHIWDTDRWLIEQTLTDEQGRDELAALLQHTPTPQEIQEWSLEMRAMSEAEAAEAEGESDLGDEEPAGGDEDDEEDNLADEATTTEEE